MAEEIELRHLRDKNGKKIAPFAPEAAIYDESGKRLSDKLKGINLNSIREAQDEALSAIDEKENEAIGNFSSQRVIPDMLSPEVMALIEASGGGTINNMPDGEDLTSKDIAGGKSVMQLADRPYNPSAFSGKGYTILRKNISPLSRSGSANILTQDMINEPNTVYEVRYDFDLNGAEITVPEGCIIEFKSGSFKNGTLRGNNTVITSPQYHIFNRLSLQGSFLNKWNVEWFGASSALSNNEVYINLAISQIHNLVGGGALLLTNEYKTSDTVYFMPKVSVIGVSRNNFNYTASPKDQGKAAIKGCFTDKNKWIVDVKYPNTEPYKYNDFINITPSPWADTRFCGLEYSNFDIYSDYNTNNIVPFGAMKLVNIYNCRISNIGICGTFYGLLCTTGWNNTFDNLFIRTYYNALYLGYNFTVNTFINAFLLALTDDDSKDLPTEKVFVREDSYPPYIDVKKPAIILEGSDTDRTAATFLGYIFQDYTALCIGSKYNVYIPRPYLENKNLFDTLIWNFDGNSEIVGYFGGFYNCKLDSYEFGTINGCIISDGIPCARCYDNTIDERIDKRIQENKNYLIKNIDIYETAFYDTILSNDEGKATGFKKTPTKQLNINHNTNVFFINSDKKDEISHPLIYLKDLFVPLIWRNGSTFDNILSLDILPKDFTIQIRSYNSWKTEKVVIGRNVTIKPSSVPDSAVTVKLDDSLKLKDSSITFLNDNYSWVFATDKPNCAFEVYGNVTINDKGIHEIGDFGQSYFLKLCGDNPVNVVINTIKRLLWTDNKLEMLVANKDFPHPYTITINYEDGTNRIITNIPTQGVYAQKPLASSGISIGFQYFCTDRKSTEGNRNGIMIYYAGADTWVDALGRIVE